jgi:hypothetical protein
MKKLFLLLAMAGVMVACGGNDEKKDGEKAKKEQTQKSAVDVAKEYALKIQNAETRGEARKIANEAKVWYAGLNEADQKAADKILSTVECED